MKDKFFRVLMILFVILFCVSCAGAGDGDYTLVEGYDLVIFNSLDMRLQSPMLDRSMGDSKETDYIKEFKYNDKYIFLKSIRSSIIEDYYNSASTPKKVLENIPVDQIKFYVVNIEENIIYGSFTEEEFNKYVESIDKNNMTDWNLTIDGINLPKTK